MNRPRCPTRRALDKPALVACLFLLLAVAAPECPARQQPSQVSEGQTVAAPVKPSSVYEALVERYANRDSLYITIIVGLVALLLTVLKDKLKDAANWLLDALGRLGRGKLAERRFLRRYLGVVIYNHKYLRLVGIHAAGVSRPLLEEVFVSLRIVGQTARGDRGAAGDGAASAAVPFAAALRQNPKMVILGGPGAGKTTTLSHALLTFARDEARARFGLEEKRLPLFVPLRRLSGGARALLEDVLDGETQILTPEVLKEHPKDYFERKLKRGECVVLLDGLDEVVDEATHRRVADKINSMVAAYPRNRYVVTCRTAGWRGLLSGEFAVLQTQDFNREEIQRFVHGWHRAVVGHEARARLQLEHPDPKRFEAEWARQHEERVKPAVEALTRGLLAAVDASSRILTIAVNPMLLSLICLVHHVRRVLPKGRPVLYSQCIELLIDAWDRTRDITWATEDSITPQQKEAVLREIAYEFQRKGVGEDTRENLEALIASVSSRLGIKTPAPRLLSDIEQRSGLLVERSIGVYGFSHLTLQEYLVARHLQLNYGLRHVLFSNLDRQEWREVTLLYAGLLDDATDLIKKIIADPTPSRLVLAAHCIGDAQHCGDELSRQVINALLELLLQGAHTDEIIEALSSVAADFDASAATAGQKLSVKLLTFREDVTPKNDLIANISILAKAKVTKALPDLTRLLLADDEELSEAAAAMLVSFGNLALAGMEGVYVTAATKSNRGFSAPKTLADTSFSVETRFYAMSNELPATDAVEGLMRCVDVLAGINTTASAKLLLKLYDCPDKTIVAYVSLALAQMLRNPFIEADLQEIGVGQLPDALRRVQPDGAGWRYEKLPPGSGFPHIDTTIRRDLYNLITEPSEYPLLAPPDPEAYPPADEEPDLDRLAERLSDSSFKLLYPVLLEHVRARFFADAGSASWLPANWYTGMRRLFDRRLPEYFMAFDFDKVEEDKLAFLTNQIEITSPASLDYSLRSGGATTAGGGDERWWVKLVRPAASVILYIFFYPTHWVAFSLILVGAYTSPGGLSGTDAWMSVPIYLFTIFNFALFVIAAFRLYRLKDRPSLLVTAFAPIFPFLKVLPHLTRARLWVKVLTFHVLFFICNIPGTIFLLLSAAFFLRGIEQDVRLFALTAGISLTFVAASLLYLKFEVLNQNPIYQLMLLHPEGRRLAGVEQEPGPYVGPEPFRASDAS